MRYIGCYFDQPLQKVLIGEICAFRFVEDECHRFGVEGRTIPFRTTINTGFSRSRC